MIFSWHPKCRSIFISLYPSLVLSVQTRTRFASTMSWNRSPIFLMATLRLAIYSREGSRHADYHVIRRTHHSVRTATDHLQILVTNVDMEELLAHSHRIELSTDDLPATEPHLGMNSCTMGDTSES